MSNLDLQPAATLCGGDASAGPTRDLLTGRTVRLGESTMVRRLLPTLGRRMVGAWCFVDHYGPDDIAGEPGMQVPPHPHMGLQTVSWLHDGEVLHRDSLGSLQTVRPRELGLMTSGRAISHSEESPREHPRLLHGAQLWVALPDAHRHTSPAFEYHPELPTVTVDGLHGTVILGSVDGATSPGTTYTPLVGVDLTLRESSTARLLPLEPQFEYAALSISGSADIDGVRVEPGSLLYLGCGRRELPLLARTDAQLLLLGGEPFEEHLIMWWNFVGRTDEDIRQAREEWVTGTRFGDVHGYDGARLAAPEVPQLPLRPRGRAR